MLLEDAHDFAGETGVAPEDPGLGLGDDLLHQRSEMFDLLPGRFGSELLEETALGHDLAARQGGGHSLGVSERALGEPNELGVTLLELSPALPSSVFDLAA